MSKPISKKEDVEKYIEELNDPELQAIAGTESSFGRNLEHAKLKAGMHKGMAAGGAFGMMPYTASETFKRDPELQDRHMWFQDYANDPKKYSSQITEILNEVPELAYDLARSHFNYLKGDMPEKFYKWNMGQNTAPTKREVREHPYVRSTLSNLQQAGPESSLLDRETIRRLFRGK